MLRLAGITDAPLHPRFAQARLAEALADTPVVLIHGPRQSGKTTLARMVGDARGYAYFSFDDDVALAAAEADPLGFVAGLPERTILDEVQRAPGLFTALKTSVDRRRTPGPLPDGARPGIATTSRRSSSATCATWPASARSMHSHACLPLRPGKRRDC